jgi:four helix bundle protein
MDQHQTSNFQLQNKSQLGNQGNEHQTSNSQPQNKSQLGNQGNEHQTSNFQLQNKSQPGNQGNEHQTSNSQPQNKSQLENLGNDKPADLRERLLLFAKRILKICRTLPKIPECEGIRRQLADSGTSIGANFEEADGALSKKDFINKVGISRKEAKETRFWLRIISGLFIEEKSIQSDIKESEEIINILSSILRKSGVKKRR